MSEEEGCAEHGEDEFYDPEMAGSNSNGNGLLGGNDIQIDLPDADDIDGVDDEPDAF